MTRRALSLFGFGLGFGLLAACGVDVSQYGLDYLARFDDAGASGSSSSGSASSSSSSGGTGTSSGSNDDGGTSDDGGSSGSSSGTGTSDGGGSSGAGGAKLVIAHAAPGLGPFRICFATTPDKVFPMVLPSPPLPDRPGWSDGPAIPPATNGDSVASGTPGIYPGTVQALASLPGASFQSQEVQPFLIDATAIAVDVNYDGGAGNGPNGGAEESCIQLIGSHGYGPGDTPVGGRLTPGSDFWALPTQPAGKFKDGTTYLLALTGCTPNYAVSAESAQDGITAAGTCGAKYTEASNTLAFQMLPLDTTTAVTGLGLQFVNLSTPLAGNPLAFDGLTHAAATGGVQPGYMTGDGTFTALGTTASLLPAAPSAVVSVPPASDGGVGAVEIGALTLPGSEDGGAPSLLPYPGSSALVPGDLVGHTITQLASLSNWQATMTGTPASFVNGKTYTVVLLGNNDPAITQIVDPDLDTNPSGYDGRGLHLVAFPNQFTGPQGP